jgi:hypothetical protein
MTDTYKEVVAALEALGYKDPRPTVTYRDLNHFTVKLGGAYFGIWDTLRKTFAD